MINKLFESQVKLLVQILPQVIKEKDLALHGGTAINLFYHDMPRLSVDIDLTYIPASSRVKDLDDILAILERTKERVSSVIPGINIGNIGQEGDDYKLFCKLGNTMVKIEVNTVNRGIFGDIKTMPLCQKAQLEFNLFIEVPIVSTSQLFGGKVVAALDRQHPRDLFDISVMFKEERYTNEIHQGVIFSMLSSKRPFHELLKPNRLDQQNVLASQFNGMTYIDFTYSMFEETREKLITMVNEKLTDDDKNLLISFASGVPVWNEMNFSKFPGIQWKLRNVRRLKEINKEKYKNQLLLLEKVLQ